MSGFEPSSPPPPLRLHVATAQSLQRQLRWPARGLLPGVVSKQQADSCAVLDLRCGLAAMVVTQSFLESAGFAAVRAKIETEPKDDDNNTGPWGYCLYAIAIAPASVVREVSNQFSYLETPLTYGNKYFQAYLDVIETAVSNQASDVHFRTNADVGLVRFRIDGVLNQPTLALPARLLRNFMASAFTNTIKTATGTNESLSFEKSVSYITTQTIGKDDYEGRVTGRPRVGGWFSVMRLLKSEATLGDIPTLNALNYTQAHVAMLNTALARNFGLVLVIGSTGSGKSTLLRTLAVKTIEKEAGCINFVTVESPVEYPIPGAVQISVPIDPTMTSEEITQRFVEVLRDVMRQDPDRLMVGEVRDHETAQIMLEFTMTGHPCSSTLHGDSIIVGLTRLTGDKLKVSAADLAAGETLNAIVYQKLIAALCPHCKIPAIHPQRGLDRAKAALLMDKFKLNPETMFVANLEGCAHCRPRLPGVAVTGCKGRVPAPEIMIPGATELGLIARRDWRGLEAHWRGQRRAKFDEPDMTGKTAFEAALYLMSQGIVSPLTVESEFRVFESYDVFDLGASQP